MTRPTLVSLLELLALLALVAAQGAAVMIVGLRGIDGFDMSIICDGGYRVYSGQVPYRDFHIPLGPAVPYLQAAFFAARGGFDWTGLILHAAVVGAVATALVYFILRQYLGALPTLGFTALTALTFYLPLSFPWTDQTAFAFFLVGLACYTFASRQGSRISPRFLVASAMCSGIAAAAALYSKHNVGAAVGLALFLLWGMLRLNETEGLAPRTIRAWAFLVAYATTILALALVFQSRGSFYTDVVGSASQAGRLGRVFALDLHPSSFLYSLDIWLLLGVGVATVLRRFVRRSTDGLRSRALGIAAAVLAVTLFARRTGSAPPTFFASLLPLALGLCYAAARPAQTTTPGTAAPDVNRRWLVVVAYIVAGASLMYFAQRGFTPPTKPSAVDRGSAHVLTALIVIAGTLSVLGFGWLLTRARSPRGAGREGLPRAAAVAVLLAALGVGVFYIPFGWQRKGWAYYPEMHGELTRFEHVPALDGVSARKEIVRDTEEVVDWLQPRIAADGNFRPGQDLYIMPQGQQLYAVLGVESFRGVRLWYDAGLTYRGTDPDTPVIAAVLPRYIVVYRTDRDYIYAACAFYGREGMDNMPEFRRLLAERYQAPVELHGYRIYERRSDAEP